MLSRGLWRWDGRRVEELGRERGLVEDVRCAAEPEPGVIWAGGRYGIYESRRGAPFVRTLSLPTGFVTGLERGPDGVWYALTSTHGLWSRRDGRWTSEAAVNAQLPHRNVRAIAWTGAELWLGTAAGLTVVREGRATHLNRAGEPGTFLANALLTLPDGEIWAAGMGGLWVRRQGSWWKATAADGTPGRTIYSLARGPDGTIWAGGSAGVGTFRAGRWTHVTHSTGLVSDECTLEGLAVLPDGRALVGTMGSLAVYTPDEPVPPPAPLTVGWAEIPAVGADGVARLARGERRLVLRWSAPWLAGDQVEYRTRVTPGGLEYSAPTSSTELHLDRLEPGSLTVEVQARVGGPSPGPWTYPATLRIAVPRYVYETWWARLMGIVLAAGLVAGAIRLRTAHLERRQQELQRAVDAALAEVKTLTGLIPVCASCKRIRDDRGSWNQMEAYLHAHSDAQVSHGLCPECLSTLYPGYGGEEEGRSQKTEERSR